MIGRNEIPQDEWEWFGDAGHCIVGRWCRFHLTTLVGSYMVSTIGAYVHPRRSKGTEADEAEWLRDNWPGDEIGCGRKYETMVFRASGRCLSSNCNCGMPTHDGLELVCRGYNTPGEAKAGHMELCRKFAAVPQEVRT